jgi:RNA polymerase sigma factor for flagellar operon FliA
MSRLDALAEHSPASPSFPDTGLDLAATWQAYSVSRDEALRNRLLIHYLPISRTIARQIHGRLPADVELDDLAQAAILGLRSAISTFKIERGIPFEHYCGPRVRGAVLDHLRSLDWAPRMLRSRVQRMKQMIRQIEMETGAPPTDEELSTALNLPPDEFQTLRSEMAGPVRIRLTSSANGKDGGEAGTINLDMVEDLSAFNPLREAQRSDLREFIVKGLSRIERQVVLLYYYENQSLREIGETLQLCESRVSQIHQAVIKRLRERMHRIGGKTVDD